MAVERIQTPLFSPRYGPLSGMRVLVAGSIVAGPTVGTLLGDLGAEVIHIERPGTGDVMRLLPPLYEAGGKKCILGSYLWFIRQLNTNSNH